MTESSRGRDAKQVEQYDQQSGHRVLSALGTVLPDRIKEDWTVWAIR